MRASAAAVLALAAALATGAAIAQSRLPNVERFTATTTAMKPSDIGVRIDIREWSDDAGREAVVAALEQEADAAKALSALPTLGYVWQSDSAVGYAVKYAHRVQTGDGERVTVVTDKRIGSYEFQPWTAGSGAAGESLGYSVIELYLDQNGTGEGTMSLAAEIRLDKERSLVSLETANGAPRLLANAKEEPKPYWASGT